MESLTRSERKSEALRLRQLGKSYAEIGQELGVPKSTLSGWLKGVGFSEAVKQDQLIRVKQIWGDNLRQYNVRKSQLYLKEREKTVTTFAEAVPELSKRDFFFLVMGLFWGEGCKKERFKIKIANADPLIIKVCMKFFREYNHVPLEKFRPYVHIHHNVVAEEAVEYWAKISGIPEAQIKTLTVISSASKGKKPKNTLPYGTFHLIVSNSNLTQRMYGFLQGVISKSTMPE